jgi:hypothetical protein
MSGKETKLRAGDWVEVKSPTDIAGTLDENGTLDGLPFMPEMATFCGRRFRVRRFAEKTCMDVGSGIYQTRAFYQKDILLLDELRCSGAGHDGCQRMCSLFWKSAWLRKVDTGLTATTPTESDVQTLSSKLKVATSPGRYFCQSTQLSRITEPQAIRRHQILSQCFRDIRSGAVGIFEMVRLVVIPYSRKTRNRLFGERRLAGTLTRTPTGTQGLRAGDLVEVKPLDEIRITLDRAGRNRGLPFDLELGRFCGKRYRVLERLDRMISESTGEMRRVEGTVFLDGTPCLCSWSVGGCPRRDFSYWRELWLKRVSR